MFLTILILAKILTNKLINLAVRFGEIEVPITIIGQKAKNKRPIQAVASNTGLTPIILPIKKHGIAITIKVICPEIILKIGIAVVSPAGIFFVRLKFKICAGCPPTAAGVILS